MNDNKKADQFAGSLLALLERQSPKDVPISVLDFNDPANAMYLSNDPAVIKTLEPGHYKGFVLASTIGLTARVTTIGGITNDETVELIVDVLPHSLLAETNITNREVRTQRHTWNCSYDPAFTVNGLCPIKWIRNALVTDRHADTSNNEDMVNYLIDVVESVNPLIEEGSPGGGFGGSYVIEREWHSGRALRDSMGLIWSDETGDWFLVTGAYGKWQSSDPAKKITEYGMTVLAQGSYGSIAVAEDTEWKSEVISGVVNRKVVDDDYKNTPYGTISMPAELAYDALPGVHEFTAKIKVTMRNKTSMKEKVEVLKFKIRLHNQNSLPFLGEGTSVGNWPFLEYGEPLTAGVFPENVTTIANEDMVMTLGVDRNMTFIGFPDNGAMMIPDNGRVDVHTPERSYPFNIIVGVGATKELLPDQLFTTLYDVTLTLSAPGQDTKVLTLAQGGGWDETEWTLDGNIDNAIYFNSINYDDMLHQQWKINCVRSSSGSNSEGITQLWPALPTILNAYEDIGTYDALITATIECRPKAGTTGKAMSHTLIIDASLG